MASPESDRSSSFFSSYHPNHLRENVRERLRDEDTKKGTVAVLCLAAIPLFGLLYMYLLMILVPEVSGVEAASFDQATIVYTADGEEITRYYTANRKWVPIDSIAQPVIDALIATEDRRFYEHSGIDIVRTGGSFIQTLTGNPQGGSTITMQLARNMFENIGRKNVFTRKLMEYFTAVKLEDAYSKDEILELYLNIVPFNFNAYGIEAAAQTYYDTTAFALDATQAAVLIGMLRATTYYNPRLNPDNSEERRNVVLKQMQEAGYISAAEYDSLSEQPLELDFNPTTFHNNMAPYFASFVRIQLEDWAEENGYNLYTDGLRVYTTISYDIQTAAQDALQGWLEHLQSVAGVSWNPNSLPTFVQWSSRFAQLTEQEGLSEEAALDTLLADESFVDSIQTMYTRVQGGFIAMNPNNGHIKAWVGGRNFERDEYDHVYMAHRQPGSTFKPFVYATALAHGYTQNTLVLDAPVRYEFPWSGDVWSVENFGNNYRGPVPIKVGLAHSLNTVTARLMLDLGADAVADMAYRMGIESELEEVPSLGLGTSLVTLLEMATAYSTIADNGQYHEPIYLQRIEATDGRVIERFAEEESQEAVSPAVAYGTLDMMRGVIDFGTGVRMRGSYGASGDLAGKTGTTTDGADTWFFLLHPDMVMGAWVGFKSPLVTFSGSYWGQGSHAALPVVGRVYQQINLPTSATFEAPPGWTPPASIDTTMLADSLRPDSAFSWEDFFGLDDEDSLGFGEEDSLDMDGDTTGVFGEEEEDDGPETVADSLTEEAQEDTNLDELLEEVEEDTGAGNGNQGGGNDDQETGGGNGNRGGGNDNQENDGGNGNRRGGNDNQENGSGNRGNGGGGGL